MLADTITLTINGVAVGLVKINQEGYASEYRKVTSTSEYRMKVRHTQTTKSGVKYDRHNLEVVETIFAVGDTPEYSRKYYFVLEVLPSDPNVHLADAICDLQIATSDAFLGQLLNWET